MKTVIITIEKEAIEEYFSVVLCISCTRWLKSIIIFLVLITRGVLAQSPEPKANDKVLDNNTDKIGI